MKICILSVDPRGLDSAVAEHFGRAGFLTLFDSDTGDVDVLPNSSAVHDHGSCDTVDVIRRSGASAVICHAAGRRALARLAEEGIPIFVSSATHAGVALSEYLERRLPEATAVAACGGGGCGHHGEA